MLKIDKKPSKSTKAARTAGMGLATNPTDRQTIAKSLRQGTLALAIVPVIVATIVVAALAYLVGRQITQDRVQAQLSSIRSVQAESITTYANDLKNVLSTTTLLPTVIDATKALLLEFPTLKTRPIAGAAGAKEALKKYYEGDFTSEFAKKNSQQKVSLTEIFKSLPEETLAAQQLYIATNENGIGKKDQLLNANDGSEYSRQHAQLQPLLASMVKKFGFYDFFIVDPATGYIVYTYFKELDYGTNLLEGPYAKTPLADAFKASRNASTAEQVYLSDFAPYLPSYNDQAAFMSVPIFDGAQQIAVMIVQVPIDKINKVMTFDQKWDSVGLGKTGQSFLVGKDTSLRSISREASENLNDYVSKAKAFMDPKSAAEIQSRASDIGLRKVSAEIADKAVNGEAVAGIFTTFNGEQRLVSAGPIKLFNQNFAVVSEMSLDEALSPVNALLRSIAMAALATLALVSVIGFLFAQRLAATVTKPLELLKATVAALSNGSFDARTNMKQKDEFGDFGRALDTLLDERVATLNKASKENEVLNNSVIEIMQAVGSIATAKDLRIKVPVTEDVTGAISDALNLLTNETGRVLRNVGAVSRDVAQATIAVKGQSELASEAASREQREVKFAAGELAIAAAALNEIAASAKLCNEMADRAVVTTEGAMSKVNGTVLGIAQSRDLIRETEKRIKRLGERSQEIGQVVNIIQGIAERTGILALNASMHAAAAGEAGRNFAVVADEVKRLSESARESTSQISRLITAIQTETNETVVAMNQAITQVVEISRMADDAGKEMHRTQSETESLASSVRHIAFTSNEQAKAGGALQERARIILEASSETARQLSSQSVETRKLVEYAKVLIEEVRVFKVSE